VPKLPGSGQWAVCSGLGCAGLFPLTTDHCRLSGIVELKINIYVYLHSGNPKIEDKLIRISE